MWGTLPGEHPRALIMVVRMSICVRASRAELASRVRRTRFPLLDRWIRQNLMVVWERACLQVRRIRLLVMVATG